VTYYIGSEQKTIWVNQDEFETEESKTMKIGFKK
jgi:hypothetical protein